MTNSITILQMSNADAKKKSVSKQDSGGTHAVLKTINKDVVS